MPTPQDDLNQLMNMPDSDLLKAMKHMVQEHIFRNLERPQILNGSFEVQPLGYGVTPMEADND